MSMYNVMQNEDDQWKFCKFTGIANYYNLQVNSISISVSQLSSAVLHTVVIFVFSIVMESQVIPPTTALEWVKYKFHVCANTYRQLIVADPTIAGHLENVLKGASYVIPGQSFLAAC